MNFSKSRNPGNLQFDDEVNVGFFLGGEGTAESETGTGESVP